MFEILKIKHITSKKNGKVYTIAMLSIINEDETGYYKLFMAGKHSREELEAYNLVNVGYGIGLTDGIDVYSAENII